MSIREELHSLDNDGRIAAIYYLYLSLDKTAKEEKARHFDSLFDIRQNIGWYLDTLGLKEAGETVPEDEAALGAFLEARLKKPETLESFSIAFDGFARVRERVMSLCEDIIKDFSDDERYERAAEEIDRLLSASPSGIVTYDSRKYLWVFVLYSLSASVLSEKKRKFLAHFCRLADIEAVVLAEMEETAKSVIALGKKRLAAKASNEPYAKVVAALAALDAEEAALLAALHKTLGGKAESEDEDTDDDGEAYDVFTDPDTPLLEKIGMVAVDVLNNISDGLGSFASKL